MVKIYIDFSCVFVAQTQLDWNPQSGELNSPPLSHSFSIVSLQFSDCMGSLIKIS